MRLVFAGTPQVAVPSLDALVASRHEVVAVVTRPDAPAGRGKRLVASPVARRAEELGLAVLKPHHPRDGDFVAQLGALAPDCCPVVAYGAILPPSVLTIPVHGWVNLHFSLLPRWRGAAPVQRAIMAGDTETGACVFDIVSELDAGDVYAAVRIPITGTTTAGDLLDELASSGARLLVDVMDALEAGTAVATPQSDEGVTIAPKLTVAEAQVDWSADEADIGRQIRGCTPHPGAWTTFRGERFKILRAHPADGTPLDPGAIVPAKQWLRVGTGGRPLELDLVQPFGRKPMPASDWARGVAFTPAERFGA